MLAAVDDAERDLVVILDKLSDDGCRLDELRARTDNHHDLCLMHQPIIQRCVRFDMTRICEESGEFSLSLMIKICFLLELSGIPPVNRGLLVLAMAIVTKHSNSVRRISSRRKCDPAPPGTWVPSPYSPSTTVCASAHHIWRLWAAQSSNACAKTNKLTRNSSHAQIEPIRQG